MRNPVRLIIVVAAAGILSGCVAPMSGLPYPVTSNSPNPEPAPGYRVLCQSTPMPIASLFDARFTTGCRQVLPTEADQVVIRARG